MEQQQGENNAERTLARTPGSTLPGPVAEPEFEPRPDSVLPWRTEEGKTLLWNLYNTSDDSCTDRGDTCLGGRWGDGHRELGPLRPSPTCVGKWRGSGRDTRRGAIAGSGHHKWNDILHRGWLRRTGQHELANFMASSKAREAAMRADRRACRIPSL